MPKTRKPTARQRARVRNEKMFGCVYYGCPPPVARKTSKQKSRARNEKMYGCSYV